MISKKKEGPLQTSELRKILMYLRYCQGRLVLSHFWCLSRNYLWGQRCSLQHRKKAVFIYLAQSGTSSATSCCAASRIFKTQLLLCLYQPLIVSTTPRCPQDCLFKPTIPPKYLYTLKKTSFSLP